MRNGKNNFRTMIGKLMKSLNETDKLFELT